MLLTNSNYRSIMKLPGSERLKGGPGSVEGETGVDEGLTLIRERIIPGYELLKDRQLNGLKTHEVSELTARNKSSSLEVEQRPSRGDGDNSAEDEMRRDSGGKFKACWSLVLYMFPAGSRRQPYRSAAF